MFFADNLHPFDLNPSYFLLCNVIFFFFRQILLGGDFNTKCLFFLSINWFLAELRLQIRGGKDIFRG